MAFATANDVAIRLGRPLTANEEAFAGQIIDTVTDLIVEAAGKAEGDLTATYFRALCVEKVIAVGANPSGLASESEQIGAYQHSRTFSRTTNGVGVFLTDDEKRDVRRAAEVSALGAIEYEAWPAAVGAGMDFVEDGDFDSEGS